ncbi:MAG TPA: tetratricopeptide repeat protein [Gemmatimonadaceae bacterium]|nr:tetratricopeptide repeat protein [Gemmatimonadaceae bacterium]
MSPPPPPPPIPARAADVSIFVATILGVVVLIGALLSFDLFLARIDRRESDAHAADEYNEGARLLQQGRPSDAVERFGTAASIDRANVSYALGLAEAMLAAGRTTDAEATLRALLDRAENDGAVNLVMAHVMIREGKEQEAKAYFHRAIFGRWGADSLQQRRQARFELIDLLARRNDARELLAELLPFEEVSPDSLALRRRLGALFLRASSPARAADMFRDVLRRDPNDADAYAGMGEAALGLGNFRTAKADFAAAESLRPTDTEIARRAALSDTLVAIDPTARGLNAHERWARSMALVSRTLGALAACSAPPSAGADSARALLAQSSPTPARAWSSEKVVGLAVDLWSGRPPACDAMKPDDVLRLLQLRVAQ